MGLGCVSLKQNTALWVFPLAGGSWSWWPPNARGAEWLHMLNGSMYAIYMCMQYICSTWWCWFQIIQNCDSSQQNLQASLPVGIEDLQEVVALIYIAVSFKPNPNSKLKLVGNFRLFNQISQMGFILLKLASKNNNSSNHKQTKGPLYGSLYVAQTS